MTTMRYDMYYDFYDNSLRYYDKYILMAFIYGKDETKYWLNLANWFGMHWDSLCKGTDTIDWKLDGIAPKSIFSIPVVTFVFHPLPLYNIKVWINFRTIFKAFISIIWTTHPLVFWVDFSLHVGIISKFVLHLGTIFIEDKTIEILALINKIIDYPLCYKALNEKGCIMHAPRKIIKKLYFHTLPKLIDLIYSLLFGLLIDTNGLLQLSFNTILGTNDNMS